MREFAPQRRPDQTATAGAAPDRAATVRAPVPVPAQVRTADVMPVHAAGSTLVADGRPTRIRRMATPPFAAPAAATGAAPQGLATRIRAASHPTASTVIQRWVNEDFGDYYKVKGVPTQQQLQKAKTFIATVSGFAEQAASELLRGDFAAWGTQGRYNSKGKRFLAFINLLKDGNPMAVTHVGNVVEERVYQLMAGRGMGETWHSQKYFGTSRPDIAIEYDDGRFACVDITSDVAHVVGKPGLWSTSEIVYVGEAVFPSVTNTLLAGARDTILNARAVSEDELAGQRAAAEAQAAAKQKERDDRRKEATRELNFYGTVKALADAEFDGSVADASEYLRDHGVTGRKGMTRKTGKQRSGLDLAADAKKKQRADKIKRDRQKKRQETVAKNRPAVTAQAVPDVEMGNEG